MLYYKEVKVCRLLHLLIIKNMMQNALVDNWAEWTGPLGGYFAVRPATFLLIFLVLAIWSLVWKGMALWKAARLGSKGWFAALLIINTLGILEILYLYVFSKNEESGNNV